MIERIKELRSTNITDPSSLLAKAEGTLAAASELIHRSYLSNLEHYPVLLPEAEDQLHTADVALFKLDRLVTENRQAVLESAAAAYTALGATGYTIFFFLESDGYTTELYIGTRGTPKHMNGKAAGDLLSKSFNGHFPGSQLSKLTNGEEIQQKLDFLAMEDDCKNLAITAVTGIPALNTEEREHFTQGLERFLDAAEGEKYRALLLAEPLATNQLNAIRTGFEATASQLSPLQKQQLTYGVNESESIATSLAESLSASLGETIGLTETKGTNRSISLSESTNKSTTKDPSMFFAGVAGAVGFALGGPTGGMIAGAIAGGVRNAIGTKTSGSSISFSDAIGTSESSCHNTSTTETTSQTESKTDTATTSVGSNRQISLESINKPVEQLLTRIDRHLERLDEARAYGGWQTAAYFIAEDTTTAEALGSMFLGLMRGSSSGAEDFALSTWNKSSEHNRKHVLQWLKNLTHPHFKPNFSKQIALDYVTPAALLSGRELAIQLSLPRRSTSSVTVLEVAAYGRSVGLLDLDKTQIEGNTSKVMLGYLRHLWRDTTQPLHLALDKLCYHTLITGTTGVGKTTAIMSLLAQVHKKGIPFLAIEPAKGEYRRLLGLATPEQPVTYRVAGRTGPDALRINPMVFPEGIELTDHIDRICTVFNAAFPMYAAMPQVLEEAIFTAYEELGWDSINSYCAGGKRNFPTLRRVADLIPDVVKTLGYSEQLSSDYVGALSTRLRSLCRGSLGMTLLCSAQEETTNQELFEQSAVVDLSPMGSPEKRALLMGILFMRMYEKRMAEGLPEKTSLRHLMVLEEAHVLLKRTSTDQSQEGSNPRGLAVEAFSNALAEMRAYGQGFIVADQSASALDDAVLRNTNTKIVMRAPFEADRIALGGALALNEEQTQQLAKLENQTAVIHQSNWLEPVLCRIKKIDISTLPRVSTSERTTVKKEAIHALTLALWRGRLSDLLSEKISLDENSINNFLRVLSITGETAVSIKSALLKTEDLTLKEIGEYIPVIFPEFQNTAFRSMTTSKEGIRNSIQALLEKSVHTSRQANESITRDIYTLLMEK